MTSQDISNDCLFIVSCQGGEKLLLHQEKLEIMKTKHS